jgi:C4-type Zn-finger protein
MKPIQMNAEMTKAVLGEYKTQTRRIAKINDVEPYFVKDYTEEIIKKHSRYQKHDILWVREPVKVVDYIESNITMKVKYVDGETAIMDIPERFLNEDGYIKTSWIKNMQGIPSGCIKEMARIFLKITDVRVEKLQDTTIKDMLREGIELKNTDTLIEENMIFNLSRTSSFEHLTTVEIAIKNSFIELWNKTLPRGCKWNDNPYIFVCEFERVNRDGTPYKREAY